MESAVARHRHGWTLPRSPRLLSLLSDERLVQEVRAGNAAAFEAIYDRHHRALLSFCRHLLGSQAEAEDALQQTFVSAYTSLISNDARVRVKPWLFTIARNRCISTLRRRPVAELDDEPSVAGLDQHVHQRMELRELLADMQRLPEEQRAALILSELRDLSHEDIATVLDCSTAKVKSLVFQGRSHLIEYRAAREAPCDEIRAEIATARRGAPSRRVRHHVAGCAGCTQFRDSVRRQRKALQALLPVVPALALRGKALAAAGCATGSGGGAAAAGGLAALSQAGGLKLAAVLAAGAASVAVVGTGFVDKPQPAAARRHAPPSYHASAPAPPSTTARGDGPFAGPARAARGGSRHRAAAARPMHAAPVRRSARAHPVQPSPRPHHTPAPPGHIRAAPVAQHGSAPTHTNDPPSPAQRHAHEHHDGVRSQIWAVTRGQGHKYGLRDH